MNLKNDPQFKANMWTCLGCDNRSDDSSNLGCPNTQAHVLQCRGYSDLRDGKNLESDKDLVEYFAAVIRRRMSESC